MYNKHEKDFKKEDIKQQAWNKIAKELNISNGKEAEQYWRNLKKLLSKRRCKLKEVDVSGASVGPVNKARKALKELNYLCWLFPFVKVRTTKSNLTTSKEIAKEEDCPNYDEDDENVDPQDEGQNEEKTRENVDSSEESLTKVVETSTKRTTEEPEEKNDTEILKRKSTVGSGKVKSKVSKREDSEIEEEELKALEVINKLASAEENKGGCEIFGELVATELKAPSQKQFLMTKHEIQNVLFKVRMEALEADLNDRPTSVYFYSGFIVYRNTISINCTASNSTLSTVKFKYF